MNNTNDDGRYHRNAIDNALIMHQIYISILQIMVHSEKTVFLIIRNIRNFPGIN